MLKFLIEAFKASKGRMPNNMEMILLRQKAAKQSIDERKVVSMFDRSAVNPNKPIMGGKNIPETEEQIKQRLMDQNKKGIKSLEERVKKNKEYQDLKKSFEDPEERAMGGRIGYSVGAGKKGVQALLDLVIEKFGKKAVTTADKAPIPPKTLERDMFKKFNNKNPDPKRQLTDKEIEEYEMELGDSETWMNDGTLGDAEQALKNHREYMEEIMRRKDAGEFGNFSSSKLDNVNDEQIAAAVDDIFPTGDPKYDAEMASEALVENNPQIFGDDVLLDDLDDETRSKIYGAVYDVLSNNMSKMRELKKLSKPEKTLQSMKEGKGIDISDPEIADEFTRFMKEKDPKGYKELEQKLELSNFDTKNRKKNASGGIARANFVGGGGINLVLSLTKNFMRATGRKPNPDEIKKMQKVFFENAENKMNNAIDSAKTPGSMSKDEFSMNVGGGFKAIGRRIDDTAKKMDNADKDSILRFIKEYNIENKADGGIMRSAYAGGGMGRRGFLKMLGGVGAGIGALKTGILGFGGKQAGKEVAKEVVKQSAGTPPPYFFKLAEKIKMLGDDATATTDRTIAKTLDSKDGKSTYLLEEDVTSGDTIIKKINKEGDEMITDVQIMELRKSEVVEGPGGKPVKTPDEYEEVTETNMRIEGDVYNDPYYSDGIEEIEMKKIIDEVGEQAPSIKKAGGGIARMLGE